MAQLTGEQFDRILQAAEDITKLREETGLDLSVLAVRGVQGYTVTISNPEDVKPPLIMQKVGENDIRSQIGRIKPYSPESARDIYLQQIRAEAWRTEWRPEDGEQ